MFDREDDPLVSMVQMKKQLPAEIRMAKKQKVQDIDSSILMTSSAHLPDVVLQLPDNHTEGFVVIKATAREKREPRVK